MRLGWLQLPFFFYQIRKGTHEYQMLARPASNSGGDLYILWEALVCETYRPILKLLPNYPVRVVDVGANIGAFAIWLHHHHAINEAFLFEPDPDSFDLCRFNLIRNQCQEFSVDFCAIGGTSRKSIIYSDSVRPAQSSLYPSPHRPPTKAQEVNVVALSEWLKRSKQDFDLLKCDCEGAEWEILEMDPGSFARFRLLVVEVHRDPSGKRKPRDFERTMMESGFDTIRWDGHENGLYIGRRRLKA